MMRMFVLGLIAAAALSAQSSNNYAFHLENGARVLYQVFSYPGNQQSALSTASASGNVIQRIMRDEKQTPWLAFELHIDRKPGTGPIRFLLSMQPLGGASFFGQKPVPREIENGDRILLDVLEEPGTGRKIFDTFQVGIDVPMQIMPVTRAIPEIPAPGAAIHIDNPTFSFTRGADSSKRVRASAKAAILGATVSLTVPDDARYLISSQPQPGFRMEAVAEGNRLTLIVGADIYRLECAQPVMTAPGASYLWVRREALPARSAFPNIDLTIQ